MACYFVKIVINRNCDIQTEHIHYHTATYSHNTTIKDKAKQSVAREKDFREQHTQHGIQQHVRTESWKYLNYSQFKLKKYKSCH